MTGCAEHGPTLVVAHRRCGSGRQYFDPDGPAITHDDAAWAISTAQSAAEGAQRISESGGLSRFEPS